MFKPTRGPQKPSFKPSGINPFSLIKYLEQYQKKLELIDEKEAAFRIEMLVDFFKNDYDPSKPLCFDTKKLGF